MPHWEYIEHLVKRESPIKITVLTVWDWLL